MENQCTAIQLHRGFRMVTSTDTPRRKIELVLVDTIPMGSTFYEKYLREDMNALFKDTGFKVIALNSTEVAAGDDPEDDLPPDGMQPAIEASPLPEMGFVPLAAIVGIG
jgi:hypothetical protein